MIKRIITTKPTGRKPNGSDSRGFICRLNFENTRRMEEYLAKKGCSFSRWVKEVLEGEASKIEKMIELTGSDTTNPPPIGLDMGTEQIIPDTSGQEFDYHLYSLYCPICDDQEMYEYLGKKIKSKAVRSWIIVWRCPRCGYSFDTADSLDSRSMK